MKLKGASRPHRGAPAIGCSTGAKKYRDKRHDFRARWRHVQDKCECRRKEGRLARQLQQPQKKLERQGENVTVTAAQRKRNHKLEKEEEEEEEEEEAASDYYKSNNNNHKRVQLNKERWVNTTQKGGVDSASSSSTEILIHQAQQQQQKQQQQAFPKGSHFHQAGNSNVATIVSQNEEGSTSKRTLSAVCQDVGINVRTAVPAPAPAEAYIKTLKTLVLMPLISCCYNTVESLKANTMKIMRVQQSFVPKRSSRAVMNCPAADVTKVDVIKANVTAAAAAAAAAAGAGAGAEETAVADLIVPVRQRKKYQSIVFSVGWWCQSPTVSKIVLCFLAALLALLPQAVVCDESDNFFAVNSFSIGPETTTPEFDYASRGQKKFGDKCDNTLECGFPGSICDPKKKSCQCTEDLPVTNHIDKCGKEAAVNESCFFNEQCEVKYFQTECRDGRCICRFEMTPFWGKDGSVECKGRQEKRGPETYIDPAMIGVLVGMALMFVIICVVLRLFSQARWRENRTIFNTPNPRLMNVSLLRDSKLLHGQERRGSRMSVRAPSRQPSMASLRPHSPNPSLGSNSHSGSNASAASGRSARSNSVAPGNISNSHHERKTSAHHQQQQQHQPHQHHHHHHQQQQQQQEPLITNITANPGSENVTVEIIVPEKK